MKTRAFTLVEVMIVVLIVAVLSGIAIPNFIKTRTTARQKTCINNMKQIESAKEQWAMDKKKAAGDACAMSDLAGMGNYLHNTPVCPGGGTYSVNTVAAQPSCSLSAAPEFHALP
ncbi:MAG: prepilin-type N-terminal cleavage/methylation domain-containing protein [Fimbriimonas sp.]|nr:prepilin-type N-terminal cleavage/methylation domain-containing protein [Fimbriimonas sp.]